MEPVPVSPAEPVVPPTMVTATTAAAVAEEEVLSEVQDYLQTRDQRRRLFPRALLVGALAGSLAVAFRAALAGGDSVRTALLIWAHHYPVFGWLFPILFSATGAALSVLLVRRFAPEASGSGIPHLEAVLRRHRTIKGSRVLPVKFLGGVLAIGAGLALGREGPTVQMGASVADIASGWLKSGPRERRTLLAAGAGAGLAAAFNAPLSGLVFVLEEVQRDFRPIVFGAAFVAAAVADVIARAATGQLPVFAVPSYPVPALLSLPVFLVLGVIAGVLSVCFNRALLFSLNVFARFQKRTSGAVLVAGIVGGAVGLVGWFVPSALGGGHGLAESTMAGKVAPGMLPVWFAGRFALTMASYATGAPGGIFAPLLALGALIGLGVGDAAHALLPGAIAHPEIFAVVGMAAYFTGVVRAPLTGIVLILEMTGNYGQMLPLIVACFGAYIVAEALGDKPIYEALLERDLLRGGNGGASEHNGAVVMEFTIEHGADFDGKLVRELGLPAGCILVSGRDEQGEWVPSSNTRLKAEDRLTAVIGPEAAHAHAILREGAAAKTTDQATGKEEARL